MAGMFYSLEEVAKKLEKSTEDLKELIKQGKLREFRDGPNLLFKVDEVEALMSDTSVMGSAEIQQELGEKTDAEEITLSVEPQEAAGNEAELTEPDTILSNQEAEPSMETSGAFDVTDKMLGESQDALEDTSEETIAQSTEEPADKSEPAIEDLVLADDTISDESSLTDEVLLTEDTLGETKTESEETMLEDDTRLDETRTESAEVSLEEIEEDVNLDTFGSGSGLLDLSLQADDTSLGGILDEIYTSEDEDAQESIGAGSVMDVASGTKQMLAETLPSEMEAPLFAKAYVEPEPDTLSNAFGIMLFLPFLVIVYTAIIAVSGFNNVMPTILKNIQPLIWYVLGGVLVVSLLIVGVPFMLSGKTEKTPKKKKEKPKKKKSKPKKKKGEES